MHTFSCTRISQKNSREIPVYHAFFLRKKTLDFIQNWVLLPYGSSYQNICIAYIFRITHPVKLSEKLIRGWWTFFGWLHVNYPISISPASDFLMETMTSIRRLFCKQAYFLWNVIFLVATFCQRPPPPQLYVIRWYGKTISIGTDCTCIINCNVLYRWS